MTDLAPGGNLRSLRWADYGPMGSQSRQPASEEPTADTEAALTAALAGDRRAGDEVLAALKASGGRTKLLDQVAVAAAQGPTVALELLLAAIDDLGIIRGAVRQLVLDQQAVEDVTQDTLIVVAEKIGTFRGEARFSTWLHQIARFKAIAQREGIPLDTAKTRVAHGRALIAGRLASGAGEMEVPD